MSHDLDDLLELIYNLELRIIELETQLGNNPRISGELLIHDDQGHWYWDHG